MQNNSYSPAWMETLARHHDDPDHTVGQLKKEVFEECNRIVEDSEFTWDDLYTRRSTPTAMLKAVICFHAYMCLRSWMDEREISNMLGFSLNGFKSARYRGRDINGSVVTR